MRRRTSALLLLLLPVFSHGQTDERMPNAAPTLESNTPPTLKPTEPLETSEDTDSSALIVTAQSATSESSTPPDLTIQAAHTPLAPPVDSDPLANAAEPDVQTISWRERYTLGPGDVINIRFYGRGNLDRPGVRIAPDGTLSYLQVNSIQVDKMTIDELRATLEEALSSYFRNPRLIITPWELKSKRYVILGKVVDKGIFTLDRPITLLEAIARSRGIETGLFEQSTVEVADMDRSFVIRNSERMDVDFAKLYFEGDLSQNIYLEPGDYIFLASNLSNEYYVLGSVARPGAQGFSNRASIISAVTRREGFTEGSWRDRVLVIRGSLNNPQTHIINVKKILAGVAPDFPLQPGDIVYVNDRPWYKAEQILDRAIQNFLKSATAVWVSENVPDIIVNPWFKRTGWREAEDGTE